MRQLLWGIISEIWIIIWRTYKFSLDVNQLLVGIAVQAHSCLMEQIVCNGAMEQKLDSIIIYLIITLFMSYWSVGRYRNPPKLATLLMHTEKMQYFVTSSETNCIPVYTWHWAKRSTKQNELMNAITSNNTLFRMLWRHFRWDLFFQIVWGVFLITNLCIKL